MQHWNFWRDLLRFTAIFALSVSLVLAGCADEEATVDGTVSLTAGNTAALDGLTFDFPNATIFGFPGESATLEFAEDGSAFTLTTSGDTVITGTITFGSCRLTQEPAPIEEEPFDESYDTCEVTNVSDGDIEFDGSGDGTVTLRLGGASETPVESDPEDVVFTIDADGNVTINDNVTPIGVVEE